MAVGVPVADLGLLVVETFEADRLVAVEPEQDLLVVVVLVVGRIVELEVELVHWQFVVLELELVDLDLEQVVQVQLVWHFLLVEHF